MAFLEKFCKFGSFVIFAKFQWFAFLTYFVFHDKQPGRFYQINDTCTYLPDTCLRKHKFVWISTVCKRMKTHVILPDFLLRKYTIEIISMKG